MFTHQSDQLEFNVFMPPSFERTKKQQHEDRHFYHLRYSTPGKKPQKHNRITAYATTLKWFTTKRKSINVCRVRSRIYFDITKTRRNHINSSPSSPDRMGKKHNSNSNKKYKTKKTRKKETRNTQTHKYKYTFK